VNRDTLRIVIPSLGPPAAILERTIPKDSPALIAAVQRYLDVHHSRCRATTARIPYYSNADPHVWVAVESSGNCSEGALTFSREKGVWEYGKLFPSDGIDTSLPIVSRVREHTAITIRHQPKTAR
jgi:hypothetical protein